MSKKAKESGNKRDQDKKMTKRSTDSAAEDVSEEKEKSIYLAQIRILNEKLERYEQKCNALEAQKKDLSLKHRALEQEKADVVEFLKRSLLERDEEVDRLSERLERVRQEAQRERQETQQQHQLQMERLQSRSDALTVENKTLVEKLTCVEQFLGEKDQLMGHLDALKKQLSRQEEEHRVHLHNRDVQALMEKNKWEKTLESLGSSLETEVQRSVHQKLPEGAGLALRQNKVLTARFSQLSQHTRALLEENAALHKKKTELRLDVENLEQMLREVSRNNCVQKRVVDSVTEQCSQLQAELSRCRQKHQQLHSLHSQSVDELETLRQDKASASNQCNETQHENSRLEAEQQQQRRKRSEMRSIIQKGCIILREALMEVDADDSKERVDRWKLLMQKLLVLLETSPL